MQKVTKLLLVLLMLPFVLASAASNKKVSEKRMAAYLMVFHRDDTHSLYMALSRDGYHLRSTMPVPSLAATPLPSSVASATPISIADPTAHSIL